MDSKGINSSGGGTTALLDATTARQEIVDHMLLALQRVNQLKPILLIIRCTGVLKRGHELGQRPSAASAAHGQSLVHPDQGLVRAAAYLGAAAEQRAAP